MKSKIKNPDLPIMLVRTARHMPGYTVTQPLGILYIASTLRRHGYRNVCLVDMRPDCMSTTQLIGQIRAFRPRFLGLSSLSYEYPTVVEIIEAARGIDHEMHICLGGPLPSSMKAKTFEMLSADSIVIGEGEETVTNLINTIGNATVSPRKVSLNGISGLLFKSDGAVSGEPECDYIQNLDQLPLPAWEMLNIKNYFGSTNFNFFLKYPNYMSIMTSRGCPYHCAYCHNVLGKTFRKRSVDSVMGEVHTLVSDHGIREFHIIDDSFNLDLDRAKAILGEMGRITPPVAIAFPNGLRSDRLDEEFLVMAKAAGVYKINFAVETASPRLQKKIRKNLNLRKVRQMIEISDKLNILCHGFFMLGFPSETEEEMLQTVDFALTAPLHSANFFIVQPFDGTDIYEMFKEQHPEMGCNTGQFSYYEANFEIYDIPRKRIQQIVKDAHRRFFLNPRRTLKLIRLMPRKSSLLPGAFRLLSRGFIGKG